MKTESLQRTIVEREAAHANVAYQRISENWDAKKQRAASKIAGEDRRTMLQHMRQEEEERRALENMFRETETQIAVAVKQDIAYVLRGAEKGVRSTMKLRVHESIVHVV